MVELTWYQNNFEANRPDRKWYVRPVIRQMLNIHDMARHMAEHHTPFSEGTIEGVLTDFTKCMREMILSGRSVKIDNLAIFKITLNSRAYDTIAGIGKATGRAAALPKVGSAVKRADLHVTPTGEMRDKRIEADVRFGWDTEAQEMTREAKEEAAEDAR